MVELGGVIADAGGPDYQRRAQQLIAPLARLLAAARQAGITILYATDAHTPVDAELRTSSASSRSAGSPASTSPDSTPIAARATRPGMHSSGATSWVWVGDALRAFTEDTAPGSSIS